MLRDKRLWSTVTKQSCRHRLLQHARKADRWELWPYSSIRNVASVVGSRSSFTSFFGSDLNSCLCAIESRERCSRNAKYQQGDAGKRYIQRPGADGSGTQFD